MLRRLWVYPAIVFAAAFLATPAQAQVWRFDTSDDRIVFQAHLYQGNGAGFSLYCAERTPQAPAVLPVYYEGTILTQPDAFYMAFETHQIGLPAERYSRDDVLVVIGDSAFRLPEITWDDYEGEWGTILQATGPMFDAIAAAQSFEIHSTAGVLSLSSAGFAAGYASILNTCGARFAAIGKPWVSGSPLSPGSPPGSPLSMRQVAEADVAKGCAGPSTLEPDTFLSGNIDGDGVADVVLDWGGVRCSQGAPRPFCGAAACSADVYLSSAYYNRRAPEMLLALGVRLQPLNNGNMAVAVGGSLRDCSAIGLDACEFLFYWNGADLVNLP